VGSAFHQPFQGILCQDNRGWKSQPGICCGSRKRESWAVSRRLRDQDVSRVYAYQVKVTKGEHRPSTFVRSEEGYVVGQRIWVELMEKLEKISPGVSTNI